jgi:hypothetical protein
MTTVAAKPAAPAAEEQRHRLTALESVAALSLDALLSVAYGPEAAALSGSPTASRVMTAEPGSWWLVLHASLASKHPAVVNRRLADVATIFLPISFLAGFWGQNFDVLTRSIEKGWPAFLLLGVGLSAACTAVTVFVLSRRGWN